jgi:hypothetical protein
VITELFIIHGRFFAPALIFPHPQSLSLREREVRPFSLWEKGWDEGSKRPSPALVYLVSIPMAFWSHWVSQGLYVLVALVWLVPDRRIEHALAGRGNIDCIRGPFTAAMRGVRWEADGSRHRALQQQTSAGSNQALFAAAESGNVQASRSGGETGRT